MLRSDLLFLRHSTKIMQDVMPPTIDFFLFFALSIRVCLLCHLQAMQFVARAAYEKTRDN